MSILCIFAGQIKSQKFNILISSGGSASFINQEIVRALNIPTSRVEKLAVQSIGSGSEPKTTFLHPLLFTYVSS
jgi:hypothetical protein